MPEDYIVHSCIVSHNFLQQSLRFHVLQSIACRAHTASTDMSGSMRLSSLQLGGLCRLPAHEALLLQVGK